MHGFVNLFLAGALAYFGADEQALVRTLEEQDAAAFRAEDDVIRWHNNTMIADPDRAGAERVREQLRVVFV